MLVVQKYNEAQGQKIWLHLRKLLQNYTIFSEHPKKSQKKHFRLIRNGESGDREVKAEVLPDGTAVERDDAMLGFLAAEWKIIVTFAG